MLMSIDQAIARWDDLDAIIDVRSPAEWWLDHIPGAINAPVLSNEERIEIGTLYKTSAFEAKKRGAALVARNIAMALEDTFAQQPRGWRPLVYCWRGGNRSHALATVMHRIGWKVAVLEGGYAAYRKYVISDLERCAQRLSYTVICGVTGSGKTAALRQLEAQGHQVLDLERLAHHRGSLLGHEPTGAQPSQKYFETQIWNTLRRFTPDRPVFVESESRKIGAVQLPEALIQKMRDSDCIELLPPMSERVMFLCREYDHFFKAADTLIAQLSRLTPLVGHERLQQWIDLIHAQRWPELVESLLIHHYDPTYTASMRRNYARYPQAERMSAHSGSFGSPATGAVCTNSAYRSVYTNTP